MPYDINTDHKLPKATKRVSSGKYLDLADLRFNDLDIDDINKALNHIYRFTGHYKDKEPLTVAQHLKLCGIICDKVFPNDMPTKLDVLMHDWAEAYTGDIATPLKKIFGQQFRDYEDKIESLIYQRFWFNKEEPFNDEIKSKRKICDLLSLDIERRSMWRDQRGKDQWPDIPMEAILPLKEKFDLFDKVQSEGWWDIAWAYDDLRDAYLKNKKAIPVFEIGEATQNGF